MSTSVTSVTPWQDTFGGMTSKEYTAALTAISLDTVPGIYAGAANQVQLASHAVAAHSGRWSDLRQSLLPWRVWCVSVELRQRWHMLLPVV